MAILFRAKIISEGKHENQLDRAQGGRERRAQDAHTCGAEVITVLIKASTCAISRRDSVNQYLKIRGR